MAPTESSAAPPHRAKVHGFFSLCVPPLTLTSHPNKRALTHDTKANKSFTRISQGCFFYSSSMF